MSSKSGDPVPDLRLILDALADSVAEASDEEILAECQEAGEDLQATSARVRDLLLEAVEIQRRRRLEQARVEYERCVRTGKGGAARVPTSPDERRGLLSRIMERMPELEAGMLTAQHRELKDLTDADVASYLRDLERLGVLDRIREAEDGLE